MKFPTWPNPLGHRDIKLGLERIDELLERVGNPHKSLPPIIHVAGTNGKGSTLAFLEAIFTDAKYKVHKYTSPHLVNFNERIVLAGREIEDDYLKRILNECKKAAEKEPKIEVTFFEGITVAAFLAFSRIRADVLLLETGMGGRLDATNVIEHPMISIITPISFDHMEFLGNYVDKIAFEKAGIIKPFCPVITGKQEKKALETIEKYATKNKAKLHSLGKDFIAKEEDGDFIFEMGDTKMILPLPSNLHGSHQIDNAATAIAAILTQERFTISPRNIVNGLKNAYWPARLENIVTGNLASVLPKNYHLFVDGGHNEDGAKAIANWINRSNMADRKAKKPKAATYLICAMLKDKNEASFLKYLCGSVDFIVGMAIPKEPKSKAAIQIATKAAKLGVKSVDAEDFEEAFQYIAAIHEGDGAGVPEKHLVKKLFRKKTNKQPARIVICGSLYFAGKFLEENYDM